MGFETTNTSSQVYSAWFFCCDQMHGVRSQWRILCHWICWRWYQGLFGSYQLVALVMTWIQSKVWSLATQHLLYAFPAEHSRSSFFRSMGQGNGVNQVSPFHFCKCVQITELPFLFLTVTFGHVGTTFFLWLWRFNEASSITLCGE